MFFLLKLSLAAVKTAIDALKAALEKDDVETIKTKTTELMQASMKLGEAAYAAQQAGGAHAEGDHGHDDHGAGHAGGHGKDDVIDADFREVGDDDKKKRA